jgi:Ca2+-transporting ATPase
MTQRPREKDESVFARGLKEKILLRGTLIGICTIFAFLAGKYYGMNLQSCRTLALGTLIISQLLHVFECRSENHSIFEIKLFTNIYLVAAVGVSILMLMSIISMFHNLCKEIFPNGTSKIRSRGYSYFLF